MRKDSKGMVTAAMARQSAQRAGKRAAAARLTIGMDLGDRTSRCCVLNEEGEVVGAHGVATTRPGIKEAFGSLPASRIAIEVGTHSPWISRLLSTFGHEVIVANARKVRLISQSGRKNDNVDAQTLARLARVDPQLLSPVKHRSETAQTDKAAITVRADLVETRTKLVNAVRGVIKPFGERIAACDADAFEMNKLAGLPKPLQEEVRPLVEVIEQLTKKIKAADKRIEQIAQRYPETKLLTQVYGVGSLIALTFVLTLDDPHRFRHSRDAGCYVGLQPEQRSSGNSQPQLGITRNGDRYLRCLLVQAAHCLLNQRAPDSDLKRWGTKLCSRGGKNARKRAVIAVARKLAVLLHRLWVTGEVYDPLYNAHALEAAQAKRKAKRRNAA